jgi:activator of 2-hydroxyglutaryl-CoA dehydratase
MPRLATKDLVIRNEITQTVFTLLRSEDNTLLDFKVEILKELGKTIKSKEHALMDPTLLDCLVSHRIIVDEAKAKIIDESTRKVEKLKEQLDKLRKKGKYRDYREMKQQLIRELKESDALGLDLGQSSKYNNAIIKEVLAVYFDVLKNKSESPLLKSVFLGLPQFTQYVNVEIVWDLINVLREYLKMALDEETEETEEERKKQEAQNILVKKRKCNI